MRSKQVSLEEAVALIPDGATVAIGGSSLSRKPMALVRALARTPVRDLDLVVDVGGPDVDLLIGCNKVRRLRYAYVGFELLGLAPHFRRARQEASIEFEEWTEFTVMAGLDAHIKGVGFLPTRTGLGTDLLAVNRSFARVVDPFTGQTLVAVPAIAPDVALIHVNVADRAGNAVILGDSHIDALCAKAARITIVSAEAVVDEMELQRYGRDIQIPRVHVKAIVEAPWGAHFTACAPSYRVDMAAIEDYLQAARQLDSWQDYLEHFVLVPEETRIAALGGAERLIGRLWV
ncbi:MAG: CoA transferase subunit A [Sulfobacillus sp.]